MQPVLFDIITLAIESFIISMKYDYNCDFKNIPTFFPE